METATKNITQKKLVGILMLVGKVRSNSWNAVRELVLTGIADSKTVILEKKWADSYKNNNPDWYKLDLTSINTWSTHDGECIELYYAIENGKLICNARIYDGYILDGRRKELRFTANIQLPMSFIRTIEGKILYALDKLAEFSYEDYLEQQRREWIKDFKNGILN